MSKPIPAVVAPAVDVEQIKRRLHRQMIEWQDAQRAADAAAQAAEKAVARKGEAYERAREKALAVGQTLVEARKGIAHGGWLKFLADEGLDDRRARECMALVGVVESKSAPVAGGADLPSRREAQKARAAARRATRDAVDDDPPDEGDDSDDDDGRPYGEATPAPQHVTIHAQTVQIAATAPGSVVVQQAMPTTPGARMVATAAPRLRRIHQLLHEAAREWDAMLGELRPLVESGQIPRHAVDPLLRLPDAAKMRDLAGQILGAAPAGECRWCGGRDPKCDGCKGRFWLDKDRLALAAGDAEAAAQRSAS